MFSLTVRTFYHLDILVFSIFVAGCTNFTPEQKIALEQVYKNLQQNSETVEVKSYDSTPEILTNLKFQEVCVQQIKGSKNIMPEIKTYVIVELDVKNYNCKSIKNYIGTKDKDDASAYFFWDNEQEKVICVIQSMDTCKDTSASLPKEERCPFPTFQCSQKDFTITKNSVHIELNNTLSYIPSDITAKAGSYVTKEDYGKLDAKKDIEFHSYCNGHAVTNYSDGRIIVDINDCDFPIINNVLYVPMMIEYTNDEGIRDGVGTTIQTNKQ